MIEWAAALRRAAIAIWLLLMASVAAWPFASATGWFLAAVAFVPLALPLPGIVAGSSRALRAGTLALAPLLAIAVTEYLVDAAARPWVGASLALSFAAFAAIVAALRAAPQR